LEDGGYIPHATACLLRSGLARRQNRYHGTVFILLTAALLLSPFSITYTISFYRATPLLYWRYLCSHIIFVYDETFVRRNGKNDMNGGAFFWRRRAGHGSFGTLPCALRKQQACSAQHRQRTAAHCRWRLLKHALRARHGKPRGAGAGARGRGKHAFPLLCWRRARRTGVPLTVHG
jgi:hypothetical protein